MIVFQDIEILFFKFLVFIDITLRSKIKKEILSNMAHFQLYIDTSYSKSAANNFSTSLEQLASITQPLEYLRPTNQIVICFGCIVNKSMRFIDC